MHQTVAKMYEVFEPYRLGDDFAGCEHCVSVDETAKLMSKPVRELSASDLDRFAFKSMTTWGNVKHFKHFLPRLFELLLDEFSTFNFPEVLIRKLSYAKWFSWPEHERDAVNDYLEYMWGYHLAIAPEYDGDDRVAVILEALESVTGSIDLYLERFLSQNNFAAAHHLREIISELADDVMEAKRCDAKLTRVDGFVDWLVSGGVRQYLKSYESEVLKKSPWLFEQLDGMCAALAARE